MKKIVLLPLLSTALLTLSACTVSDAMLEEDMLPIKVKTVVVSEDYYNEIHNFSGLLRANKKSVISADVAGEIQNIFVKPGQVVVKGEKLAILGDNQGQYELDISLNNAKSLLFSTEEMFSNLQKANIEVIKYDEGMVEASKITLEKMKTYSSDLKKTFQAQLTQSKAQVRNAEIGLSLANYNLDSFKDRSNVDKLSLQNQVDQQALHLFSLQSQLKNQKDINDEIQDSAKQALENAEDILQFVEDNLANIQADPNASSLDISNAEYSVRQAKNQVEMAEEALDGVDEQIDSSEDNLRQQIDLANKQFTGSNYISDSSLVKIDDQYENLKYNVDLAKQTLNTTKISYELLEKQMNQALNKSNSDVLEATINVANLQKKLELTKKKTAVNESELKTNITDIKGKISILKSKIENKTLIAPFDGAISQQFIQEGSMVKPGSPVFELSDIGKTNVEWYVPENKIDIVQVGKTVFVYTESNKIPIVAEITEIEPTSGVFSKKVRIEAKLLDINERFINNTYVQVEVMDLSKDKVLLVPLSAVEIRYKDSFIYIVENEKTLSLRKVVLGPVIDGNIIVLSGLISEERVVTNPSKKMSDDVAITLINE